MANQLTGFYMNGLSEIKLIFRVYLLNDMKNMRTDIKQKYVKINKVKISGRKKALKAICGNLSHNTISEKGNHDCIRGTKNVFNLTALLIAENSLVN